MNWCGNLKGGGADEGILEKQIRMELRVEKNGEAIPLQRPPPLLQGLGTAERTHRAEDIYGEAKDRHPASVSDEDRSPH